MRRLVMTKVFVFDDDVPKVGQIVQVQYPKDNLVFEGKVLTRASMEDRIEIVVFQRQDSVALIIIDGVWRLFIVPRGEKKGALVDVELYIID